LIVKPSRLDRRLLMRDFDSFIWGYAR